MVKSLGSTDAILFHLIFLWLNSLAESSFKSQVISLHTIPNEREGCCDRPYGSPAKQDESPPPPPGGHWRTGEPHTIPLDRTLGLVYAWRSAILNFIFKIIKRPLKRRFLNIL